MIITKLNIKNNIIEIFVDEINSFHCSENFQLEHDLYEGKVVENFSFEELKNLAEVDLIKQKAKNYCSTRLLCKSKLRNYIQKISKRKGISIDKESIEKMLNEFEEYNLINDYEYTRKIVDSLTNKKKGLGFIKQKLHTLGIDKEIIINVLSESFDSDLEAENLKSLIEKKRFFLEKKFTGDKLQQKLISFCIGKGYSFQDIKSALNPV